MNAEKSIFRKLVDTLAMPVYKVYNAAPRHFEKHDLQITVMPGVFHPLWFLSSELMTEVLPTLDLQGKRFLDLGCATAMHACMAARRGAIAYASDIGAGSCRNARLNALQNRCDVEIVHSDLFEQMAGVQPFDIIFVNPPFEARYPEEESDFSFCCGESYEYYHMLFSEMENYLAPEGRLYMVLSESCAIPLILEMAEQAELHPSELTSAKRWGATHHLYCFSRSIV